MKTKLLSLLGLARRAGRLSLGNDPVLESIRKKESCLLLAAEDLSPRTAKGIRSAAGNVPLMRISVSMEEIGMAVGKRAGILSVNDAGFANRITEISKELIVRE